MLGKTAEITHSIELIELWSIQVKSAEPAIKPDSVARIFMQGQPFI
jgi:hypothetical protein